jgi:hypothetical protein
VNCNLVQKTQNLKNQDTEVESSKVFWWFLAKYPKKLLDSSTGRFYIYFNIMSPLVSTLINTLNLRLYPVNEIGTQWNHYNIFGFWCFIFSFQKILYLLSPLKSELSTTTSPNWASYSLILWMASGGLLTRLNNSCTVQHILSVPNENSQCRSVTFRYISCNWWSRSSKIIASYWNRIICLVVVIFCHQFYYLFHALSYVETIILYNLTS